jgi:hypothetical protein
MSSGANARPPGMGVCDMLATEHAGFAWPPWPPQRFHYVYAAKFLCGIFKPSGREGPVEPGSYATAINVHNPQAHPVAVRKKAILLYNGERPEEALERPTPPARAEETVVRELGPDWGLEIDCADIRAVLLRDATGQPGPPAPVFIKGWVVVETLADAPLDVVAVYTVNSEERAVQVAPSIVIDRVPGARVALPGL